MTIRFRRTLKIAPGLHVNFNKNSTSLSLGPRGAHYTMSSNGRRTVSAGIPGTGLYAYQSVKPNNSATRSTSSVAANAQESFTGPVPKPTLFARGYEKKFFLFLNDIYGQATAPEHKIVVGKANALRDQYPELIVPLNILTFLYTLNDEESSDKLFDMGKSLWDDKANAFSDPMVVKYFKGIRPVTQITAGVSAREVLNQQQFGLIWVEVLQSLEKYDDALAVLHELNPDQIVAVSMADIELSLKDYDAVFETTNEITNEDEVTAILLVQRGIAFREQGHFEASLECFRQALAKRSRDQQMLNRAHLERAITYKKMAKSAQARKDLELVLAHEPGNEDIKKLLAELDS